MRSLPSSHVRVAVAQAIARHTYDEFLEAVYEHVWGGGADKTPSLTDFRRSLTAYYFGRENRVHYIAIYGGHATRRRRVVSWLVPETISPDQGGEKQSYLRWVSKVDKDASKHTLTGARAGSGRLGGPSRKSRSRSRPEIGRARKRRGR